MTTLDYQQLKVVIENVLLLSRDAIHIHVGLCVFVTVLLIRKRVDWLTVMSALLVAFCMEALDIAHTYQRGYINWSASLHDLLNTCFWPVVLFVIMKTCRFDKNSKKQS